MAENTGFNKMVPGFEFLQSLVKNAGSALPSMGQWVAPTLNPEELEKRIEELRTVQFWLEQNARMLSATIQALEVQRMTLSTLKTMNVQMTDLRDSLSIRTPAEAKDAAPAAKKTAGKTSPKAADAAPAATVDPMQWWGALTKQFTELAANAIKEGAAKNPAGAAVAPAGKATEQASRKTANAPAKAASRSRSTAGKRAAPKAR